MLSQTVKKDSTTLSNIKKNEQQKSNKIVKEFIGMFWLFIPPDCLSYGCLV